MMSRGLDLGMASGCVVQTVKPKRERSE
uniref:Uncharacterized protein n=1 Tax=Arundo donax TaxID=35708 RepID=A0A0A9AJR7_ARUDO